MRRAVPPTPVPPTPVPPTLRRRGTPGLRSGRDAGLAVRVRGGRLDHRHLAGERLEPGPRGDLLVVGEEDDLLLAGPLDEQLEQRRPVLAGDLAERVVEHHRQALATGGAAAELLEAVAQELGVARL